DMPSATKRRLMFNYDGWSPFYKGPAVASICAAVDRFAGTQLTTIMLSPSLGQSVNYPSHVSELCHWRPLAPKVREELYHVMSDYTAGGVEQVAALYRRNGFDGFGVLVDAVVASGRKAFATLRMNDVHMVALEDGSGPYTDAFYRAHPGWRLPEGGLNYAIPAVRAHRLAMMEELLRRYPFTGLEMDFLRGPPFFPPNGKPAAAAFPAHGRGEGKDAARWTEPDPAAVDFARDNAEAYVPVMTEFIAEARRMTERVGREQGRPIELCVRVPSNRAGCRRIGLDPVAWHQRGCLDFLTVGKFLQLVQALPVAGFKRAMPGLPVCASIDYVVGGPLIDGYFHPRDGTAEIYRGAAAALYAQGADGLTLFNMFAAQANGLDPQGRNWNHDEPLEVLHELGDPATLEGTDKLYLVDSTFMLFARPLFDSPAPLPATVSPAAPLRVGMTVGEHHPAGKTCTLRIVTAEVVPGAVITVQVNGRALGPARPAQSPHLFPEPYDQKPPEPGQCQDFTVEGALLKYGANEISVLASVQVTVTSIELAVVTPHHR
ncbi:MAG: hypothetical protein ACHQ4G_10405, partial [Opitutales bacterium]